MRWTFAAAAAAIAALGGCADTVRVYKQHYASPYEPGQVRLAATRETLAVIRNNPFPGRQDAVLAAMQGQNLGPKLRYTQTPWPDDPYGYKVVLTFTEGLAIVSEPCKPAPEPVAPRPPAQGPRRIDVAAAFCIGETLLSETAGRVDNVTGPDDPKFRRLVSGVLVDLFPTYDPKRLGDCRGPFC